MPLLRGWQPPAYTHTNCGDAFWSIQTVSENTEIYQSWEESGVLGTCGTHTRKKFSTLCAVIVIFIAYP